MTNGYSFVGPQSLTLQIKNVSESTGECLIKEKKTIALLLKAFLEGISELLILVLGLNSKKGSLVSDLSEPPSYILGLLIQILGGVLFPIETVSHQLNLHQ